jgi:hypothetical protein
VIPNTVFSQMLSHRKPLSCAAAALVALCLAGCAPTNVSGPAPRTALPGFPPTVAATATTGRPPKADAVDYRRLLLTADELTDTDDTFQQRSQEAQPNGMPGATAFFVNDKDNRAISDTFVVYQDAPTAAATLRQVSATLPTLVSGGTPTPVPVGTDGVMISGTYPGEDKAATLMLFTEGKALVRLEFQSATGDPTTDRFVTSVGKMQQVALRVGLADSGQ